jgi:hypothetical protein
MRLLVRRTRPSRRHLKKLTAFEKRTGWRYQIIATNIGRMWGIAGSHQPQWLDCLHRAHAGVEDRVRTNKAMGLSKLPSQSWTVTTGWVLAANLAADIAWTRLLALHDQPDLADAEPGTLRYRLRHPPDPQAATPMLLCHWVRWRLDQKGRSSTWQPSPPTPRSCTGERCAWSVRSARSTRPSGPRSPRLPRSWGSVRPRRCAPGCVEPRLRPAFRVIRL